MVLVILGLVGALVLTRGPQRSAGLEMRAAAGAVAQALQPGIRFMPDGSSSGGRIELAHGGRRMLVGVDWISGRVSLAAQP